MSLPSLSSRPSVGASKPANIRRSVVLPEPDGPRSVRNSPPAMSREMSLSALKTPKRLLTPRTVKLAAVPRFDIQPHLLRNFFKMLGVNFPHDKQIMLLQSAKPIHRNGSPEMGWRLRLR